jgi:hypothetical protein
MIKKCRVEGIHVAVKRNVTRVLAHIKIPKDLHEQVINLSFDLAINPKETVAVRCWSLDILNQLSFIYPEIKNELKNIIQDALDFQELTPGFKSKCNKLLRQL